MDEHFFTEQSNTHGIMKIVSGAGRASQEYFNLHNFL